MLVREVEVLLERTQTKILENESQMSNPILGST
jgi:hypothetical protein